MLAAHADRLCLPQGARVFLPLCGKSLDIAYMLARGLRVVGAERSELAIDDLFQSLRLQARISNIGMLKHYSATSLDIYVGDIFDLPAQTLGRVDATYDRAALVALPAEMREQYAAHLTDITHASPQLVIAYEYDQVLIDGPPFSVSAAEIHKLYGSTYTLTALETREVEGGMKGKATATETAWLLERPGPHDATGQ